jgi:hypothetical protein
VAFVGTTARMSVSFPDNLGLLFLTILLLLAVLVSSSLLLTAKLASGAKIRVFPLSRTSEVPLGLPLLRQVPEAGVIRLIETAGSGASTLSPARFPKGTAKKRDWIALLLKELLGLFFSKSQHP